MRRVIVLLAALACALAGAYLYPVGGSIWSAAQVSGVALIRSDGRAELAEPAAVPRAAREALMAARFDRFRRVLPGIPATRCVPLDLALRTGDVWVDVPLRCTTGLLFDTISADAWRGP